MTTRNPDPVKTLLDEMAGVAADSSLARDAPGGAVAVPVRRRAVEPSDRQAAERRALDLIGLRLDAEAPPDRRLRRRVP